MAISMRSSAPNLCFATKLPHNFPGRLAVVGEPFMRVDYVFALPLGSAIRKQVNRVILSYIETDEWRDLLRQYLGGDK